MSSPKNASVGGYQPPSPTTNPRGCYLQVAGQNLRVKFKIKRKRRCMNKASINSV